MSVKKQYVLPEEIIEIIEHRDKEKYPTEAQFVREAIYQKKYTAEYEKIREDLRSLYAIAAELRELHRMNIRMDAKAGKYYLDYPGGIEDVEEKIESLSNPKKYPLPSDTRDEKRTYVKKRKNEQ